jgi:hypothetical protein
LMDSNFTKSFFLINKYIIEILVNIHSCLEKLILLKLLNQMGLV